MADVDVSGSNGNMLKSADSLEEKEAQLQQLKLGDCRPEQSSDTESDQHSSLCVGLSLDSPRDELQDEQIEKLKEFLSEAACRGNYVVTQSDADTVKALENLQLESSSDTEVEAHLESAARANLEIQNQAASGYPSENVCLEEHTYRVCQDSGAAWSMHLPSTASSSHPPRLGLLSPVVGHVPTPYIDAEPDMKNELDCLFQERASRFRGLP